MKKHNITKEFLEKEYTENKKSLEKTAKIARCSQALISLYMKKYSISCRENTYYKKYRINEDYFEKINTKEKAYWLGFLTADGSLIYNGHRLQLDLALKDEKHVLKFRQSLGSNHKLFYSLHNRKYKSAMLSVTNRKLFDDLGRIFNRDKIPSLNNKIISHFIRGLFDGDGCVMYFQNDNAKVRVSLLGKESFLEDLKSKLIFSCNNKISDVGGIFELRLFGRYAFRFLDWVYSDSTDKIRLTRKFDKYQQILKQRKEQGYLCQN